MFHYVLHFLDSRSAAKLFAGVYHTFGDTLYLHFGHAAVFRNGIVGFCDGVYDFFRIKQLFRAVSLYYFHKYRLALKVFVFYHILCVIKKNHNFDTTY